MDTITNDAARRRVDERNWKPRNCVWELTLACNLKCGHCGSRAGKRRSKELSTAQCLDIVDQLTDLGCELVTLSGGEPTLRRDWDGIAHAIASRGAHVNMVTNGAYATPRAAQEVAARAKDAGMCNVGVSIDGPRDVHDFIRGEGTFARSMTAIEAFLDAGLPVAVMTTLNQLNAHRLEELRAFVIDSGAKQWRFQLAKPMGNMEDIRELVLRPAQMLQVIPEIARLKKLGGISVRVGDSIGYYGPHDKLLRGRGWRGRKESWQGCQAGMQAIGIESDGGVKGCLSLQAKPGGKDPFVEANLHDATLDDIWHRPGIFAFNRDFRAADLTGGCGGCKHGAVCRGGARCVAAAVTGVLTENAYCYHGLVEARRSRHEAAMALPAAAAAALALSLGAGCGAASRPAPEPEQDAAVMDGAVADAGDAGGQADAGGPVDAGPDPCATNTCCDCGNGTQSPDCCAVPEYGIEPEIDAGIDCESVCCECDYGVIPPDIAAECCG